MKLKLRNAFAVFCSMRYQNTPVDVVWLSVYEVYSGTACAFYEYLSLTAIGEAQLKAFIIS